MFITLKLSHAFASHPATFFVHVLSYLILILFYVYFIMRYQHASLIIYISTIASKLSNFFSSIGIFMNGSFINVEYKIYEIIISISF